MKRTRTQCALLYWSTLLYNEHYCTEVLYCTTDSPEYCTPCIYLFYSTSMQYCTPEWSYSVTHTHVHTRTHTPTHPHTHRHTHTQTHTNTHKHRPMLTENTEKQNKACTSGLGTFCENPCLTKTKQTTVCYISYHEYLPFKDDFPPSAFPTTTIIRRIDRISFHPCREHSLLVEQQARVVNIDHQPCHLHHHHLPLLLVLLILLLEKTTPTARRAAAPRSKHQITMSLRNS